MEEKRLTGYYDLTSGLTSAPFMTANAVLDWLREKPERDIKEYLELTKSAAKAMDSVLENFRWKDDWEDIGLGILCIVMSALSIAMCIPMLRLNQKRLDRIGRLQSLIKKLDSARDEMLQKVFSGVRR